MHTSFLPTGQWSRLKEVIQMQINSDINPSRRHDNQFFLEGKYDLGQGPQEHQGWEHRKVIRDNNNLAIKGCEPRESRSSFMEGGVVSVNGTVSFASMITIC